MMPVPSTLHCRRVIDTVVSPRVARRSQSAKIISQNRVGRGNVSTQGSEGGGRGAERNWRSSGEWRLSRWRSFSGSKSKSVKIRSSGFTCYLDGPEKGRCDSHVPACKVVEGTAIFLLHAKKKGREITSWHNFKTIITSYM